LRFAEELVLVGATPSEAEAYARQMAGLTSRLAPVDLRSFERERLTWRAQRRPAPLARAACGYSPDRD
jgi:hypothetical protein